MAARESRWRAWLPALLLAGGGAAVCATGAAGLLERPVADALLRAAPAPPLPARVPDAAVVLIDGQTLRAQGEWPWPRERHARIVDALEGAGARAVALDIAFSSPGRDEGDAALAAALRRSGKSVLAAFRDVDSGPLGAVEIVHVPVPALAEAAAAVGSVVLPLDGDGVVRRARTATRIAGASLPSLPAAALAVARGGLAGPAPEREFRIDYRRARPPLPRLRAGDVLEGRFDAELVRGRVVFVGASAAEFQDLWSTPLDPLLPGVEIQALAYRTLAARTTGGAVLREAGPAASAGFALACALLGAAAGRWTGRGRGLAAAGVAAGTAAVALGLLYRSGLRLDLVVPLALVAGEYALGLEWLRRLLSGAVARGERSLAVLEHVAETTRGKPGERSLDAALGLLSDVVDAEGVALLRASGDGTLDGRRLEWRRRSDLPVGDSEVAAAVLAERALRVAPAAGDAGARVYAPLLAGEAPVGVLVVACAPGAPPDAGQLRTIATAASQLALSAENVRLLEGLRDTFDAAIAAIASAVEARDGYTELHCRRLAALSVRMGERLGLPEQEVEAIRLGALLHDVGKIGIRDDVLLKPGRLTPQERREMERHPDIGHRIVAPIPGLTETTAACVRHHHERWDGGGYPLGLAGSGIPLGARIVAVVDVWDALSTARPYKPAWPAGKVLDLLRKDRGGQFDPALVDLFLTILDEEGRDLVSAVESEVLQAAAGRAQRGEAERSRTREA